MRTKRNFDVIEPTGKKLSDLLPQILREISPPVDHERAALFAYWNSLLEEKMARFTQPVSWKNGVLTIKVKSATLYAVLQRHEKARLLKALQSKFSVQDIVFRVG
jgi:predicted nucleic acid-binding Zn ribbon protein